jgi:hypothetical protein
MLSRSLAVFQALRAYFARDYREAGDRLQSGRAEIEFGPFPKGT